MQEIFIVKWRREIVTCPNCGSTAWERVPRWQLADFVLGFLGLFRYHCALCMSTRHLLQPIALCTAMLLFGVWGSLTAFAGWLVGSTGPAGYHAAAPSALHSVETAKPEGKKNEIVALDAKALTNQDIVELCKGGVSADVILKMIRENRNHFRLAVQDLLELRQLGVPNTVINGMLDGSASPPREFRPAKARRVGAESY